MRHHESSQGCEAVQESVKPIRPSVSVVIPCYNAQLWLESALLSIRKQVDVQLEVILVDDGSSDQSCALARGFWQSSPWPLRILRSSSLGVSASRNIGWRAAQHELIAFLDADDLMLPGRLHAQASLLLREPHLGHCLTGWFRMDSGGRTIKEVRPWEEGAGFSLEQALRHKAVLPSAWMVRRSVLDTVGGFDPSLAQAEDVDLLLRLARAGVEGDWVRLSLCGYRVHPQGASRRALAQARGLSYVLERHLRALPSRGDLTRLASEVRYGTRAWLGWNAWASGDSALATQLWISALGLSPFPAGLTWVHLAENVEHSAARIGADPQLSTLLSSATWQSLERNWWHRRCRESFSSLHDGFSDPAVDQDLDWSRVFSGDIEAALKVWARQLQRSIEPTDAATPDIVDWRPDVMVRWCVHSSGLRHLQQRVLRWCEVLLQHCVDPSAGSDAWAWIRWDLAEILLLWAQVTWPEDRRPTLRRLEQSLAVRALDITLIALARLHQPTSPAGSLALLQLARAAQPETLPVRSLSSTPHPEPAPPDRAHWEQPSAVQDHCAGPQCQPCLAQKLQAWVTERGEHELVWWIGSQQAEDPAPETRRNVVRLPGGQAWLRPPLSNPWQSTHAYSIADSCGVVRPDLSRRYPQAWAGFCPHAPGPPESAPSGTPQWLDGPVLALIGLSAETYYHWLLEVLPTLALLENVLDAETYSRMRIWHNGGLAPYVLETLQHCSNLKSEQLLDARRIPVIQAEELIVATPPRFAEPSPFVQRWLRQRLLHAPSNGPVSAEAIWFRRGCQGRRPVFGEEETLSQLADLPLTVLDPAALSVSEQAAYVSRCKLVIAPHGGCLANLVFAEPGTTVLELHHPAYHPPYFQSLISQRQLRWASQCQNRRAPALYRDLLFESPATEPVILEPHKVAKAVRHLWDRAN